ncbi:MAG TPA: hypothetical protein GXX75_16550 [Clostridiales bacterium]|nr:hypothetical protein [Clostridiales bacterium]
MKFNIAKNTLLKAFNKHQQFCVGSCHAFMALRTDYIHQLKTVHDELGIKYVRFHGIFNDDMNTICDFTNIFPIPGGERFREISFHRCGIAFDNILSIGMKPFIELGFMPSQLANAPVQGNMTFYGSNVNLPKDYDEWAGYIQEFIRYLIHRYGEKEVLEWYFEVWNEPDLKGVFFNDTKQDYFKLYEATVNAIKRVHSGLRVGGPSTSGSKWIQSFITYCKENKLPLDFVSTHQYAGDPLIGVTDAGDPDLEGAEVSFDKSGFLKIGELFEKLPEDTKCLDILRMIFSDPTETKDLHENLFRKNAMIAKKQSDGLPLLYTEWNLCASFSAISNDTRKAAAYLIKTSLDIEDYVDGSAVWCFSDIFEELHQFTQEFHGGFGLQTLNGIPKPSFYALKMLAMVGGNRLDLGAESTDGEIGIAAFSDENTKQVLLFRHKMKQLSLPKVTATVSFELNKRPAGVTLYRIDDTHCNPYQLWLDEGSPSDLTPSEIEEYKEKTSMKKEKIEFSYENGVMAFDAMLGVNDIWLICIE